MSQVAERMADNYPYFHPLYAGQMLKPPHPLARAAYALAMVINPNNHALDGGRASSRMEVEAVRAIAGMFGWTQLPGTSHQRRNLCQPGSTLGRRSAGSRQACRGFRTGALHPRQNQRRSRPAIHRDFRGPGWPHGLSGARIRSPKRRCGHSRGDPGRHCHRRRRSAA